MTSVRVHVAEIESGRSEPTGYDILENGCWQWFGCLSLGYGDVRIDGVRHKAHRYVYQRLRGEIPDGLELDHLCRNRACVNPNHLEPVTHAVNLFRARKTHCRHGHALVDGNLYWWHGLRRCVRCNTEATKRRDAKRRAARMVA